VQLHLPPEPTADLLDRAGAREGVPHHRQVLARAGVQLERPLVDAFAGEDEQQVLRLGRGVWIWSKHYSSESTY
jgi:hypothetical protein